METQTEKLKTTTTTILKTAIAFLLIAWNLNAIGQDTLVLDSSVKKVVNVLEVSMSEIKYTQSEISGDTILFITKSEVQQIRYKNGWVEKFNGHEVKDSSVAQIYKKVSIQLNRSGKCFYDGKYLRTNELNNQLRSVNNALINQKVSNYNKSRKMQKNLVIASAPIAVAGLGMYLGGILQGFMSSGDGGEAAYNAGNVLLISGGVCAGASFCFGVDKKMQKKKAVRLYNELYGSEINN